MHEILHMHGINQCDSKMKRQSIVGLFQNDPTPTKLKQARSPGKNLIVSFFLSRVIWCRNPYEIKEVLILNGMICYQMFASRFYYCEQQATENQPPWVNLLHHDNAPAYSALKTRNFLDSTQVILIAHPPYSLDLEECDFFVPQNKKSTQGKIDFIAGKCTGCI